jgi:hypothetical protein
MRQAWIRLVALTFAFSLLILITFNSRSLKQSVFNYTSTLFSSEDHVPCKDLPGANDTVLVFKTGSTELEDKLPILLSTTLRCYPNHLIVSDHAETFHGHQILDGLETVSEFVRDTNPDFELYRRLQEHGRQALNGSELSGKASHEIAESARIGIPGWKLDKWKFLPMMNLTLSTFPDKKWYVFVEADTFIFWKSLLVYLASFDAEQAYYLGSSTDVDGVNMAHGGSWVRCLQVSVAEGGSEVQRGEGEVGGFD